MDPAGKGGLASITAAMLTEGAGPRGALEFADAVDYLGAQIAASAGLYTTTVALHAPLSKLDSGLIRLDLRPDDLRTTIMSAIEQAQVSARRRGLSLTAELPETPVVTRHDPQRLGQVLTHTGVTEV